MTLIDRDKIITAQLYDDEHEEFTETGETKYGQIVLLSTSMLTQMRALLKQMLCLIR